MVDLPDPAAPFLEPNDRWHVREMVRVNHLRNCLLCHPPSQASAPMRAAVPTPGQPLAVVYYSRSRSIRSRDANFVRADVVYIRQDFSVKLPVQNAHPWPEMQRFDFFVRTREARADELANLAWRTSRKNYPQRRAVLYALNKLTGE